MPFQRYFNPPANTLSSAFQRPTNGVCSTPPITPRALEAAFSGPWQPLGGSPAAIEAAGSFSPSHRKEPDLTLILGIDIGAAGALALLTDSGELVAIEDMPILHDGPAARRAVNGPLLARIVGRWRPDRAYIEFVGARPEEGAVGAFSFGRSRGVVEGVLAACGVPAAHIAPAAWKRAVGIPPGRERAKDAARSEAIRRWPTKATLFARKRDDGRAESALIAVAGLSREHARAA